MLCVSYLPPFSSPSPSPSQSQSQSRSRSQSQSRSRSPFLPNVRCLFGKGKQKQEKRKRHLKPDPMSTQEVLDLFDQLWAAQNPPPSIYQFNQLFAALVRTKAATDNPVFSLFNRLTQAERICPNDYTYAILMDYCARTNQVC